MKKKVLIIENDRDIRDIISYVLEDKGYEVIAAEPWPVNRLHTYNPDLILLDEWLNEREGHLLCTELKDMHETKHVPVIILSTANNIEEIANSCKAEGFVNKPFDLDELLEEVQRCFFVDGKTNLVDLPI
ncbi:response regulator [uncultured Mucilaginibacter sp.]|uniref:response regulator n=1 Tax=uncultured Mucilaginibacter sp. TaxID=797541 RepID=UPI0026356311|nr:response regulator [uncultured Mucilaginibacter sp.]